MQVRADRHDSERLRGFADRTDGQLVDRLVGGQIASSTKLVLDKSFLDLD